MNGITSSYLDELVQCVEVWTAQCVALAITGGRPDDSDNQPYEFEWQKHPIRSVADFERHVDEVGFVVRGIAAIHGSAFSTFALDVDRDEGRADFDWLTEHGYVTDADLIIDSPGGVHIVYRHDVRLGEGTVQHPVGKPAQVILDGFTGPRGDGSLHVTLRGRGGANVTKVPPTVRPATGERYISRSGWEWNPQALPDWFRLPQRPAPEVRRLVEVPRLGSKTRYAEAALTDELGILVGTVKGGRNDQLNVSALKLGSLCAVGVLDVERVLMALYEASVSNGHVADKGDAATWATIKSGMAAGMRTPRQVTA